MVQVCNPIVFTECATRLDQPCIMDSVILSTSDVECIDGWRPWYVELTNHDGFCRAAMPGCRLIIKRIRRLTSNCCLQIPALPPHAPSGIHPSSVHLTAPVCLFACLPAYLHTCMLVVSCSPVPSVFFCLHFAPALTNLDKHQTNKGVSAIGAPPSYLFCLSCSGTLTRANRKALKTAYDKAHSFVEVDFYPEMYLSCLELAKMTR